MTSARERRVDGAAPRRLFGGPFAAGSLRRDSGADLTHHGEVSSASHPGGVVPVAAGVLARAGRLLVCQRRAGGHHPFKWEFPGGKAEPGERAAECLRRELREELGIDPIVGRLLWRTVHRYPGRAPFALSFLAISGYRGVLTNRVFAALRWVPLGGLTAIDFLEGDRDFVARLLRGGLRLVDAAACTG